MNYLKAAKIAAVVVSAAAVGYYVQKKGKELLLRAEAQVEETRKKLGDRAHQLRALAVKVGFSLTEADEDLIGKAITKSAAKDTEYSPIFELMDELDSLSDRIMQTL